MPMDFQENFLQLVWKYQYFNTKNLKTEENKPLEIKKIGFHNFHEGPDFLEAHVKIEGIDYFGHIEIHKKSSEWKSHQHDKDPRYNTVILHVVYTADKPAVRLDGTVIPTLELKGKILLHVVRNYQLLAESREDILCKTSLSQVHELQKFSMLEKALTERMEHKTEQIYSILKSTNNNWEETSYRWLFYCFGFKTNSKPMINLAESTPYLLLRKIGAQPQLLQALFLGQAGLLPEKAEDDYTQWLIQEYHFLQKKNDLKQIVNTQDWKMVSVRPKNFPALRIVQLCEIISNNPHLFHLITEEANDPSFLHSLFAITIPEYWQAHYLPGRKSSTILSKGISKNTQNLLKINFYIPLLYAYEKYIQRMDWQEKPFNLLQKLSKEQNFIIKKFSTCDWLPDNAYDSQGMLGLYQNYCALKRCLDCKIGHFILKQESNK
jgi:hypothetical protein